MTAPRTRYSYNADTRRAQVYSRRTATVIFSARHTVRNNSCVTGHAPVQYTHGR